MAALLRLYLLPASESPDEIIARIADGRSFRSPTASESRFPRSALVPRKPFAETSAGSSGVAAEDDDGQ